MDFPGSIPPIPVPQSQESHMNYPMNPLQQAIPSQGPQIFHQPPKEQLPQVMNSLPTTTDQYAGPKTFGTKNGWNDPPLLQDAASIPLKSTSKNKIVIEVPATPAKFYNPLDYVTTNDRPPAEFEASQKKFHKVQSACNLDTMRTVPGPHMVPNQSMSTLSHFQPASSNNNIANNQLFQHSPSESNILTGRMEYRGPKTFGTNNGWNDPPILFESPPTNSAQSSVPLL